jgi:hypothetical protein
VQANHWGVDLVERPQDILNNEAEDDDVQDCTRRRDWLKYGYEAYRKRPGFGPQDKDPYVVVPPILEGEIQNVGDFLQSREWQKEMATLAGPAWPPPEDFGVQRYKLVRDAVYEAVKRRYPELWT